MIMKDTDSQKYLSILISNARHLGEKSIHITRVGTNPEMDELQWFAPDNPHAPNRVWGGAV